MEEIGDREEEFYVLPMPSKKRKQEWWIKDLLPKERLVLLAAQGGTGKTSLCFYLADLLARKKLVAEDGDPLRVAYWSFEDEPQDFVNKIGKNDNVVFIKWRGKHTFGEKENDIEKLEKFLFTWNAHILFIDPVAALLDDDGNNNQAVREVLNRLLETTADIGATVVGVHHFRKSGASQSIRANIIGASAWVDTARHVLSLTKNDDGQLFLEVAKSNIAKTGTSWEAFWTIDDFGFHIDGIDRTADGAAQKALEEPKRKQENSTVRALKNKFGIGKPFGLTDVRDVGSTASFYRWLDKHGEEYQTFEKDGKKSWIFI